MKKARPVPTFGHQMDQSMAELRAIMAAGQSPTADGRLSARTVDVAAPAAYDAAAVRGARAALNVSQAVFARLVGVSHVLVRSWERGARQPAPVARRLLDQMRNHPAQFTALIHRTDAGPVVTRPTPAGRRRRPAARPAA